MIALYGIVFVWDLGGVMGSRRTSRMGSYPSRYASLQYMFVFFLASISHK